LEDVAKSLLILALDLGFQEFEFLLKLIHFLSLWQREVGPGRSNEVIEGGVGEPKSFEAERMPNRVARSLPLERDRPMI